MPLDKHHPHVMTCLPTKTISEAVIVPPFDVIRSKDSSSIASEEEAIELQEWLSLIALESPRIFDGDAIDPYLYRHNAIEEGRASTKALALVSWSGLFSGDWARNFFLECW